MMHYFKTGLLFVMLSTFVPVVSVFAGEVIQTQESSSWDGIEADLTSLTIKNNIITVKIKFRNTASKNQGIKIPYDSCFIMDATNQKKYYPLKDSDGLYIAGPVSDTQGGGRFWFDIHAGQSKSLWIKFPEPTDNPETVTISLEGIFPFEDIALTR
ncbi:MAG: hypothetical protein JXD19_00435 [Deltaproteobacteria bacterium]|nr:hypothetical protein [Deltaproteobacteria bacterium]